MLSLNRVLKGLMLGSQYVGVVGWVILILMLLGSGCKSSSPTVSQKEASSVASDCISVLWICNGCLSNPS